jgi:hypothetical protein
MNHHSVYVIELNKLVLRKQKFLNANPNYDPSKPCVYVGLTGLDPEERFSNHLSGHKASRIVQEYGERLRPELYEHLNPMSFNEAEVTEVELARELREEGFAVWPPDFSDSEECDDL